MTFDKIPNFPAWQARHGLNAGDFAKVIHPLYSKVTKEHLLPVAIPAAG